MLVTSRKHMNKWTLPWYNWKIVQSGVKPHSRKQTKFITIKSWMSLIMSQTWWVCQKLSARLILTIKKKYIFQVSRSSWTWKHKSHERATTVIFKKLTHYKGCQKHPDGDLQKDWNQTISTQNLESQIQIRKSCCSKCPFCFEWIWFTWHKNHSGGYEY